MEELKQNLETDSNVNENLNVEESVDAKNEELTNEETNGVEVDETPAQEIESSQDLSVIETAENEQAESNEEFQANEIEEIQEDSSIDCPELIDSDENEEIKIIAQAEESYVAPQKKEEFIAKTPAFDDYPTSYSRIKPSRSIKPDDVGDLFEMVDDEEDYVPKKKKKKKKKRKAKPVDKTVLPVKAFKLFICEIFVSIPIIGFLIAIIVSLNKKANKNLRTYSKLAIFWHIIGAALFAVICIFGGAIISWIFDLLNISSFYW